VRRGVFVTGTDTGVGKTLACCALIHALAAHGVAARPMKPVAAGAIPHAGRRANDDTLALMGAAGLPIDEIDAVTPVLLHEAMAPHIAAARAGRRITLAPIAAALERAPDRFLVVEGVGGFIVPLDGVLDTVDLARTVGLPVVLVVGMRLGCLNHALLSALAIERSGLPFAGWIANAVDPAMEAAAENVEALRERLRAPLLARLPHQAVARPRELAGCFDAEALAALGAHAVQR